MRLLGAERVEDLGPKYVSPVSFVAITAAHISRSTHELLNETYMMDNLVWKM
jgi:hypothetical protein